MKSKQLGGILLFVLLAVIAIVAITVHYRTPSEENQVVPPPFNLLENATFHSIPDVIENSSDYWGKAITVEGYYTLLSAGQFVGGGENFITLGIFSYIPSIGILTENLMSLPEQQTDVRENQELPEIALLAVGGGSENIGIPNFDNTTKIELISGGKYRVTGILRVDTEIYLPFFSVYLDVRQFSEVNYAIIDSTKPFARCIAGSQARQPQAVKALCEPFARHPVVASPASCMRFKM